MDDCVFCTDVLSVNKTGVLLKPKHKTGSVFISFDDCVRNFVAENDLKNSTCVATRDITTLSFTFYSQPKTKLVFKKNFFKSMFTAKSAVSKFRCLQTSINKYGYTTYDLS